MALNASEMWSDDIEIAFFSNKLQKIAQRLWASPQNPVICLGYTIQSTLFPT